MHQIYSNFLQLKIESITAWGIRNFVEFVRVGWITAFLSELMNCKKKTQNKFRKVKTGWRKLILGNESWFAILGRGKQRQIGLCVPILIWLHHISIQFNSDPKLSFFMCESKNSVIKQKYRCFVKYLETRTNSKNAFDDSYWPVFKIEPSMPLFRRRKHEITKFAVPKFGYLVSEKKLWISTCHHFSLSNCILQLKNHLSLKRCSKRCQEVPATSEMIWCLLPWIFFLHFLRICLYFKMLSTWRLTWFNLVRGSSKKRF